MRSTEIFTIQRLVILSIFERGSFEPHSCVVGERTHNMSLLYVVACCCEIVIVVLVVVLVVLRTYS